MLDREHIVPAPVVENRQPLDALISELKNSRGSEVCVSLDNILSSTGHFSPAQIKTIDAIAVKLHRSNRESWFYQRIFELALKMYNFANDWRSRMRICRTHEKHRFKLHCSTHTPLSVEHIDGILGICRSFMSGKELIYDRVNILGYCLLELGRKNNDFLYEGTDDVFYLVEYVYRGDPGTLLRWAQNVRVMNDWSLLYLTNYPEFLYTELKYSNDPSIIREVIVQQRSHKLCSFLFIKLSMLFPREDLLDVLVESYDEVYSCHTAELFHKLLDDCWEDGEKMLKRFIKRTGTKRLSEMFYEYCTRVDGDYVEACLMCTDDIDLIRGGCLKKLVNSHYWSYLTHRYENFVIFTMLVRRRGLSLGKEHDFPNGRTRISLGSLKKLRFVAAEDPSKRKTVSKVVTGFIRRMYKGRVRCDMCYKQQSELSLDNCSISTFARDSGEEEKRASGELFLMIYDILDILRDESMRSRTIRMLCTMSPDLFYTRVINEVRYDGYFVKCMNVVLRRMGRGYGWDIDEVARMPLFSSNGFWEVAIRRLLRLRYVWKEVSNSIEDDGQVEDTVGVEGSKPRRNEGSLYSLENAVVIYPTPDSLSEGRYECGRKSRRKRDKEEERGRGDESKYLMLFSDHAKLRYLIRHLERDEKDYRRIRCVIEQLKASSGVIDGMVFRDSYVVLDTPFGSFSLQLLFSQYDERDEQVFVQLEGDSEVLKVGRTNGKLFMSVVDGDRNDHVLLSECGGVGTNIAFRSSYRGSRFSFDINGKTYNSRIGCVKRVRIGVGFKGVISKIFLCESHLLDRYILTPSHQSSFYVEELGNVEKLLTYKNYVGVYMDSTRPYFINGEINVETRNVLDSKGVYWNYNEKVMKLLGECNKDAELHDIMKTDLEDI